MPILPNPTLTANGLYGISWGSGASSPYMNGLTNYWPMEETGGTRADPVGSATLTDNNTVMSTTGMHLNAALFVAGNSERLSIASFSLPATPTVSFWFYGTDASCCAGLFTLGAFGNSTFSFMKNSAGGAVRLRISDGASNVEAVSAAGKWDGLWHHVLGYQGADGKAHLWLDAVESVSASALGGSLFVGPAELRIGLQLDYLSGAVDEVGVWNRLLTADERTTLYNSGVGKFYPTF